MLMEEIQHHLIPFLIRLLHFLLLQIAPRRHPPMHLIREPLDHIRCLNALLPLLDILLALIARREHDVRNLDAGRVVAGNHGGMACGRDFEGCAFH